LQARKIMAGVGAMRERRRAIEAKNRVLRAVARGLGGAFSSATAEQSVQLAEVGADWDALLGLLSEHDARLDAQRAELGRQLDGAAAALRGRIEAARAKWLEAKPSGAHSRSCSWRTIRCQRSRRMLMRCVLWPQMTFTGAQRR
jgi:hypothetical protein